MESYRYVATFFFDDTWEDFTVYEPSINEAKKRLLCILSDRMSEGKLVISNSDKPELNENKIIYIKKKKI